MKRYFTRMGDGEGVWMSKEEIREEVLLGMNEAVTRGKAKPLEDADIDRLVEILTLPEKNVSVEPGNEGIVTFDAGTLKMAVRSGLPIDPTTALLIHERALCSDTMELCSKDYSYKQLKNIAYEEAMEMERAQMNCVMPVFYGAMPNMGLYTKPDGPVENWSELLPRGKVDEAMQAQEEAVKLCVNDMVYICSIIAKSGACGIQFDTVGASGDADFLAALQASQILSRKFPDLSITMGMANEFTLGMHGRLKFEGERLAGQYPVQQVKTAAAAGAHSFGPVVNTNSTKSFAWNLSRSLTFVKEAAEDAPIPVLPNVGMGVGGIPLTTTAPTDCATRASKAMLEIGKADGL